MADLYLSRKLVAGVSSPLSGQVAPYWSPDTSSIRSKLLSKASRISGITHEETDVEELEMLLEVSIIMNLHTLAYIINPAIHVLCNNYMLLQVNFVQIESTMNKLTTVRK